MVQPVKNSPIKHDNKKFSISTFYDQCTCCFCVYSDSIDCLERPLINHKYIIANIESLFFGGQTMLILKQTHVYKDVSCSSTTVQTLAAH